MDGNEHLDFIPFGIQDRLVWINFLIAEGPKPSAGALNAFADAVRPLQRFLIFTP